MVADRAMMCPLMPDSGKRLSGTTYLTDIQSRVKPPCYQSVIKYFSFQ
jgi:hypothetical protein